MSKNEVYGYSEHLVLSVAATQPATPASGDPVLVGQIPGVALTAERADGTTTIATDGVWTLPVKGQASAAGAAVNVGDKVYYDSAETGAFINVDNTNGVFFGYALGAVGSGVVATIPVRVGA